MGREEERRPEEGTVRRRESVEGVWIEDGQTVYGRERRGTLRW